MSSTFGLHASIADASPSTCSVFFSFLTALFVVRVIRVRNNSHQRTITRLINDNRTKAFEQFSGPFSFFVDWSAHDLFDTLCFSFLNAQYPCVQRLLEQDSNELDGSFLAYAEVSTSSLKGGLAVLSRKATCYFFCGQPGFQSPHSTIDQPGYFCLRLKDRYQFRLL